jgi:anti-sigma-K factor RskA
MNLDELHKKLIAAARATAPNDHVPYAFEKRMTALLASRVAAKNMDVWVHGLWRAAISCAAIALVCGVWTVVSPATTPTAAASDDLSQNFESTLLASVDQGDQAP